MLVDQRAVTRQLLAGDLSHAILPIRFGVGQLPARIGFARRLDATRLGGGFGALDAAMLTSGLTVGGALIVGTFIAKHFLQSMHEKTFSGLIDVLLLVAAVAMLVSAIQHF